MRTATQSRCSEAAADGITASRPHLLLINPRNPLVQMLKTSHMPWNRYRIWQPLGLMVLAGLTPDPWSVELIDENLHDIDPDAQPRPDLVGITAFTAQAERAYELAAAYRARGIPVILGGIHATMRVDEAMARSTTVVTGDAEPVWATVLADAVAGRLQPRYDGGLAEATAIRPARRESAPDTYAFASLQTSRGCPLNCSFCSVTAFNGGRYRQRPIAEVVDELRDIPQRRVLMVDDNLIGTSQAQIVHAKQLFRAIIAARLGKRWIAQATINVADDPELLALAQRAGCRGLFIGFETITPEGLAECGKRFNLHHGREPAESVRLIRRQGILVVGSFVIGLDGDGPGIGERIARVAMAYGIDILNATFLTPLPGTRLFTALQAEDRLIRGNYPDDWRFYTFAYPVSAYRGLSTGQAIAEMQACNRLFYSLPAIARRTVGNLLAGRQPLVSLIGNLSYRSNAARDVLALQQFTGQQDDARVAAMEPA